MLDVILAEDVSSLDEVVVVAYGHQRKVSVVGAQSSMKIEDIKMPTANLSSAIAGRLPGVVAVQRSGEPGHDDSDLWIRGISTLAGQNSKPLVLVDGVERSFNNIDPEDIESFTVLKDASATAVYGVRGANGVILIKTKPGKVGKPQFSVDYYEGFVTLTKKPEWRMPLRIWMLPMKRIWILEAVCYILLNILRLRRKPMDYYRMIIH